MSARAIYLIFFLGTATGVGIGFIVMTLAATWP